MIVDLDKVGSCPIFIIIYLKFRKENQKKKTQSHVTLVVEARDL